jgi:signal transduction histidine kinase
LILNAADAVITHKEIEPALKPEILFEIYKKNDKIIISIADNGIGIPDNELNKIFDPFFSTKEVGKGTGLGLYVSFNIIKEHKGNIKVKRKYKQGTKFILEFDSDKGNAE